jgi:hypothetical protein
MALIVPVLAGQAGQIAANAAGERACSFMCILLFAFSAYEGWHILTYLKPPWE